MAAATSSALTNRPCGWRTFRAALLPPRGSTANGNQLLWRVESVRGEYAEISLLDSNDRETRTEPIEDLILVAEFRDRIYPGLRPNGTVEHGGDKPFHTVINGENFHVLEQLTFTHAGSVDAIYIDSPYNTGARDWKYNNDYVEGDDLYRHSKWLAFMERRLILAKRLLKPDDSVLIVTIDEKEYLRLGLLLEQTFLEAEIQMLSVAISPSGNARTGGSRRSDEYVFIVSFGDSAPTPLPLSSEWLGQRPQQTSFVGTASCALELVLVAVTGRGCSTPSLFPRVKVTSSTLAMHFPLRRLRQLLFLRPTRSLSSRSRPMVHTVDGRSDLNPRVSMPSKAS